MASKSRKDYFGLDRIISVILAILPTNVLLGIITRLCEGKILAGILRIFVCPLTYIVDLILIIVNGRIWRLL